MRESDIIALSIPLIYFYRRLLRRSFIYIENSLKCTQALQLDKMHEYSRRLQTLNRSILELTKRVRLLMSRVQVLGEGKTEALDLLVIC